MVYGLIGEKLSHSYSPLIHRIFFELAGLDGEYRLIELNRDELGDFLHDAGNSGYKGLNVTIPYKTEVIPFIDILSPEAAQIGAVNTILPGNTITGYNTDYFGIEYTFQKNKVTVKGKSALVTGSGGSAKSAAAFLSAAGVKNLYIASRNPEAAAKKFPKAVSISYNEVESCKPFDIIVNTTPVGMYPKEGASPLTSDQIKGSGFLFDLIYNPAVTMLMELADNLGIPNVNGLYMLVAQAVKAQEIWNGIEYGLKMADAIYERIKEGEKHGL